MFFFLNRSRLLCVRVRPKMAHSHESVRGVPKTHRGSFPHRRLDPASAGSTSRSSDRRSRTAPPSVQRLSLFQKRSVEFGEMPRRRVSRLCVDVSASRARTRAACLKSSREHVSIVSQIFADSGNETFDIRVSRRTRKYCRWTQARPSRSTPTRPR